MARRVEIASARPIEIADVQARVEAVEVLHSIAEDSHRNVLAASDKLIADLADLMAPGPLVDALAKVGAHHVVPQVLDEIRHRVTARSSKLLEERERRARQVKS